MSEDVEAQLAVKENRPSFRDAHAPGISWLVVIILMIILAFAVIHFGSLQPIVLPSPTSSAEVSTTPTSQPRIYTISYDSGVFSPTNLRIHAGDTVKFKNDSIFPIHIVSEDLVGFDSVGDIPQNSYFSFTFAARGTFSYYNSHNPDQAGTIIVR